MEFTDAVPPANTDDHYHSHRRHNISTILIIVIAVLSIISLLTSLLILKLIRRTKLKAAEKSGSYNRSAETKLIPQRAINVADSSPDARSGCIPGRLPSIKYREDQVFTFRELEAATHKFSEANVIGRGVFGVVYRGVLLDGTVAAIKMLYRERKQSERAFRMEVDLLTRLRAPYLVELLGYCADQHHRLLIFKFMPNSSLQLQLQHHSTNNQHKPLDWGTRLRIALDCAEALDFLHEGSVAPIIHRDFKCSSILLDENFRAKVSGLGMAKMGSSKIHGQIQARVVRGTIGYLAPEYASTGMLTTKSDVYSYGVVLLQLLTGREPFDSNRLPAEQFLASWALPRLTNRDEIMRMVDPAIRGLYSKKDLIQVAAIAAVCVQPEADYRPLMTDIVQSLIPLVKNCYPNTPSFTSYKFC